MSELKECPFCGSDDSVIEDVEAPQAYWAVCRQCGATCGGENNLEAEAIAAWNRRPATPPDVRTCAKGLVEAVRMSKYWDEDSQCVMVPYRGISDQSSALTAALEADAGDGWIAVTEIVQTGISEIIGDIEKRMMTPTVVGWAESTVECARIKLMQLKRECDNALPLPPANGVAR